MLHNPDSSLREARDRYFQDNGFAADGGYSDAWVDFKLGPVPFPFPNTQGRKRALKVHDLHHLVTGYRTDIRGEFEISAWEVGAGCKSFFAAWFLNLSGIAGGVLIAPRRTFAAFVRGRQTESLYGRDVEAMLESTVGHVQRDLGLDAAISRPRASDAALFGLAALVGALFGGLFMVVGGALLPVAFLAGALNVSAASTSATAG